MSFLGRMFIRDEELGKKDDDHRPMKKANGSAPWTARKPSQGPRKRRIIYGLCVALFVYLFIKNIPTDLGSNALRRDVRVPLPSQNGKMSKSTDSTNKKPPRPATPSKSEEHYHDGPIKFYKLASSLHAAARYGGQLQSNKNILFAASSLTSVAELLPLACEMARWERNDVHLAMMGRDDVELEDIRQLNGAAEECNVHWHDARPDFSRYSSDFRMEVSVTASMEHIQTFIHPQVVIIDDPTREDSFFVEALRTKLVDLKKGLIELPKNAAETMMWMTRLDSGSLAAWPRTYIDIFIQAPKESSGSLVRLLRSIEDADYFGFRRPHITIELPAEIDASTWRYLQTFVWPPLDWAGSPHASQVTLRHRIPRKTSSEEEASARLVESFYPVRTDDSNVLILSSMVELSPLYYHYVIYSLLEYKHSDYNQASKEAGKVMGFSLHLPSFHPNDTTPLDPPLRKPKKEGKEESLEKSPFLWQMPSSDAVLYFGNKWMEFHSFLSNRISKPPTKFPKIFSKSHAAWLEILLELMRARGWVLIYPNFPADDTSLATTHAELYEAPEEYDKKLSRRRSLENSEKSADLSDQLTADNITPPAPPDEEKPLLAADLISLLPAAGDLPEVSHLPLLSFDGHDLSFEQLETSLRLFSETFRKETGSCPGSSGENPPHVNSANDLFCNLDDVYDHYAAAVLEERGRLPPDSSPSIRHVEPDQEIEPIVNDEELMTAKDAQEAKANNELASHMNRQEGKSENSLDTGADEEPATFKPLTNQYDSSAEVQDEFHAQMERQAKQRSGGAAAIGAVTAAGAPANADTDKEKEKGKATKEKQVDKDVGDSASSTLSSAAAESTQMTSGIPESRGASSSTSKAPIPSAPPPPQMHGSFRKETPKQPDEGDTLVTGQEKASGW